VSISDRAGEMLDMQEVSAILAVGYEEC